MISAPSEFILEWNSIQPTPSPRSNSEAPEFFFTTPLDFFGDCDRPHAFWNLDRLPVARAQIEVGASGRSGQVFVVPGLLPGGEELLDVGRDGLAFLLHARDRGFHARGIPQFEGTHLPVKPEPH